MNTQHYSMSILDDEEVKIVLRESEYGGEEEMY